MKRALPSAVVEYAPLPVEVCPGVWKLERRLRHFGFAHLPSNTTLVRLGSGSVVMISPPPHLDRALAAAIEAIGPVGHVVVPNSFHYLYAEAVARLYPNASLLVAPALGERVGELAAAEEIGARAPEAWGGELEIAALEPVGDVSEVAFFHVATGTLILTDVAFNMTRYPRAIDRLFWRASGVPGQFGPGRTSRTLLLRDHAKASRWLERIAAWPIERIVVAHGAVIERDATSELRRAFSGFLAES